MAKNPIKSVWGFLKRLFGPTPANERTKRPRAQEEETTLPPIAPRPPAPPPPVIRPGDSGAADAETLPPITPRPPRPVGTPPPIIRPKPTPQTTSVPSAPAPRPPQPAPAPPPAPGTGNRPPQVTPPLPPKEFSPVTSLLAEARQYLRTPYLFGGADPATGFDCSGFLTYVFNQTGLPALPRTSREQAQEGREIDKAEAKAGDLVYFSHDGTTVQHIGLVISNPGAPLAMIHASTSQGVIETNVDTSSYWNKRLVGLRRVIG